MLVKRKPIKSLSVNIKKQPAHNVKPKSDARLPRVIRIKDLSAETPQAETHGTFCGVINKPLITAQCPLPKGVCFWKHRSTGYCKYQKDAAATIQSLATLVGEHVPTEETVIALRAEILLNVKKQIN